MRRSPEVPLALALLFVLGTGAAESTRDAPPASEPAPAPGAGLFDLGGQSHSKEPITVTSNRLDYDYKANIAVYRGEVEAVQGAARLRSDTLTVTFDNKKTDDGKADPPGKKAPAPDPDTTGTGKVKEIVAVGNVRIDQGERWATGGRATYEQADRTVVLTENPVLHDGPNEVAGDRVVVFLDENRSVVEGGRRRVKAVIHPDKGNENKTGEKATGEAKPAAPAAEVARP